MCGQGGRGTTQERAAAGELAFICNPEKYTPAKQQEILR